MKIVLEVGSGIRISISCLAEKLSRGSSGYKQVGSVDVNWFSNQEKGRNWTRKDDDDDEWGSFSSSRSSDPNVRREQKTSIFFWWE